MSMAEGVSREQQEVCERFGVVPCPTPGYMKIGVARSVRDGALPVHGLRHPPTEDTAGWYLWAGDQWSDDPDFFEPLHVDHLSDICPTVMPYLALPPGYRFLAAPDFEDVWHDESLLLIDR